MDKACLDNGIDRWTIDGAAGRLEMTDSIAAAKNAQHVAAIELVSTSGGAATSCTVVAEEVGRSSRSMREVSSGCNVSPK